MFFFIIGVIIALLAGYIILNLFGFVLALIVRLISLIFGS